MYWPVFEGELASSFGPRNGSFHDGIDIKASEGTPIFAAHDGKVIYNDNELSGYGNLLILKNRYNVFTLYAHCRKVFVSTDQTVKRGQQIALVGSTGRATGPHLHFEVRVKDKFERLVAVDPMPFFKAGKSTDQIRPRYRVNEGLATILAKK